MKTLKLFFIINCFAVFINITAKADDNVAYNKQVTLLQSTTCSTLVKYLNDNNPSTTANLTNNGPVSFSIDLGNAQYFDLSRIVINWVSGNYAIDYTIYTSPDNVSWTPVYTVTGNTMVTNDFMLWGGFGTTYVRYVKFLASSFVHPCYLGIYEFQVMGSPSTVTAGLFSILNVASTANFCSAATFAGMITASNLTVPNINTSGNMYLQTGGANRICIGSTGSVSIYNDLSVTGKITATGAITAGSLTSTGIITAGSLTTTGAISAGSFSTTGVITATRLNITTGSLGIGTSNPTSYKLAVNGAVGVNGTIYATKVLVQTSVTFPDYVFKNDYKLKSLVETEAFIKANKHLEGVPTETEVKEKGIDVGEMNVILLKKVEELTLLLIEQNKRIEVLEKDNMKFQWK